jgi:hypothetical protein
VKERFYIIIIIIISPIHNRQCEALLRESLDSF